MSGRDKAFDLRGFADAFGETFDSRGFADAFRRAFGIGDAGRAFVAGFCDGVDLVRRHVRHAVDAAPAVARRDDPVRGVMLLQRLAADVAGGGGAAVRALGEIRGLLRPFNPEIDRLPDDHIPSIVRRLIEDLQTPAARPEDFSGAVSRALAVAQAKAASLDFADAAQVLDDALTRTQAEDQERARGRAALLAERGRIARLQLRYREAATFYRRAADAASFDAKENWRHRLKAASAYRAEGEEFGENSALHEAIALYRAALVLVPREQAPIQWAITQNDLGAAVMRLGYRETGTSRLQEAIGIYHQALMEFSRDKAPIEWAMTKGNIGAAFFRLGERSGKEAPLKEAVIAARAALTVFTREQTPDDWANAQNNLGNALKVLGERQDDIAQLKSATAAYREALTVWSRERTPSDWRMAQINLANSLERLGEWEEGTANLEEAVAAYYAVLEECRREHSPIAWATVQRNLGIALRVLGEREGNAGKLDDAVAAFRSALTEMTPERVPLEWASTQNSLGRALIALAALTERRSQLKEAIAAFDAALAIFAPAGAEGYARGCRANRALAIKLLGPE